MKVQIEDSIGNDIVIIDFINTIFKDELVNSLSEISIKHGYTVADVDIDEVNDDVVRIQNSCDDFDDETFRKDLLKLIAEINEFLL
jgi:hypothetical protein